MPDPNNDLPALVDGSPVSGGVPTTVTPEQLRHMPRTPPSDAGLNAAMLRAEGLTHLQRLAGQTWTDHNLHDPGITILEVLSYALTDLSYRTTHPVEDLLAPAPQADQDTATQGEAGSARRDDAGCFTAAEVLPCSPVTLMDYRKLVIDCPGVKNAWLVPADSTKQKVSLGFEVDKRKLRLEPPRPEETGIEEVVLQGLYVIYLDLEQDDEFGDLNDARIPGEILVKSLSRGLDAFPDTDLRVELEFLNWLDDEGFHEIDPADYSPGTAEWSIVDSTDPQTLSLLERVEVDGRELTWAVTFDSGSTRRSVNFRLAPREAAPDFPKMTDAIEAAMTADDFEVPKKWVATYLGKVRKRRAIVRGVLARLHANRNLCEDFIFIRGLEVEEIALCADLQIVPSANVDRILAELIFGIERFLAPDVPFRSLEEMQAKGYESEAIFNGPRLDHGFIEDDALEALDHQTTIYGSDIINILMDIEGVTAVQEFQLGNYVDGEAQTLDARWELPLASSETARVPRFSRTKSRIRFFVGLVPHAPDETLVEAHLDELRSRHGRPKLAPKWRDISVPQGEYRELGEYTSIQGDFPLVYAMGQGELGKDASPLRRAQAKQLKAYLAFYEQLMADYLVRLDEVKVALSVHERPPPLPITQALDARSGADIPWAENPAEDDPTQTANSEIIRLRHENALLDHLLARFGQDLSDYTNVLRAVRGDSALHELTEDKARFLAGLPDASYGQGRGFDYRDPATLRNKSNVSGLKKRVRWLVDAAFVKHHPLQVYATASEGWRFRLEFIDGQTVLESTQSYPSDTRALAALDRLVRLGSDPSNYQLAAEQDGPQCFQIVDRSEAGALAMAASTGEFSVGSSAFDEARARIIELLRPVNERIQSAPVAVLLDGDLRFHRFFEPDEGWTFRLVRHDAVQPSQTDIVLAAARSYASEKDAEQAITTLVRIGSALERYEVEAAGETSDTGYVFSVQEANSTALARSPVPLPDTDAVDARIEELRTYLDRGEFHVVEHILLRPRDTEQMVTIDAGVSKHASLQVHEGPTGLWRFRVEYADGTIAATSEQEYATEVDASATLKRLIMVGSRASNYVPVPDAPATGAAQLAIIDPDLPESPSIARLLSATAEELPAARTRLIELLNQDRKDAEGATIAVLRDGDFRMHLRQSSGQEWQFLVVVYDAKDPSAALPVVEGITTYPTRRAADEALDATIEAGSEREHFITSDGLRFEIEDSEGLPVARGTETFPDQQARDTRIDALFLNFRRERLHLDQNTLAKLTKSGPPLLSVRFDEECASPTQWDPYSFRVSVIFPYWPARFRHMEFRRFIERTLHLEAPAHVALKICWIDQEQMQAFKAAYQEWLLQHAEESPNAVEYHLALQQLIQAMQNMTTVYPVATLHDCREPGGTNPVVLGHTQLGEFDVPEETE